ncbi:hypothetical protein KOR42_21490 [Thalassoglobus neptunius]|uniref:Uncharacterized protein n=1 Tax=Thalassoglobus neptunius TaxID=1938619 RepID=A0A5C5X8Y7_9PLAN|nr:hypothetical protein [Thalassoglobus neptunius]TWT58763.1 hypothetical protein KOR42_21490 [Thalassoglobus neptunius]
MNRWIIILLGLSVTSCAVNKASLGGDLQQIEDSVEGKSSKHRPRDSGKSDNCAPSAAECDSDSWTERLFVDILAPPLFYAVTSPWWVPASLIEDDQLCEAAYPKYPYEAEGSGFLLINPESPMVKPFALQLTSEYASDFSGLERVGSRIQLDTSSRFGVDSEWNYWNETTPHGNDTLWNGDFNVTYRFAQSETIQMYSGLGLNWLSGDQSDAGVNFTYGIDMFPGEPFVIRGVIDAGTIGDADLYHAKASLGWIYKHFEISTGYDFLHIGDTNLQGITCGLTLWF